MTITEFLLARVAEDEELARAAQGDTSYPQFGDSAAEEVLELARSEGATAAGLDHLREWMPARVLAECEAKRRIIEWHKSWPVLVETEPVFEQADPTDVNSMTFRLSKQIAWTTDQKYRERFGTEPPTGPILRFMAQPYADHPDYDPEWAARG